jgi:hypothetical protein
MGVNPAIEEDGMDREFAPRRPDETMDQYIDRYNRHQRLIDTTRTSWAQGGIPALTSEAGPIVDLHRDQSDTTDPPNDEDQDTMGYDNNPGGPNNYVRNLPTGLLSGITPPTTTIMRTLDPHLMPSGDGPWFVTPGPLILGSRMGPQSQAFGTRSNTTRTS